MLTKTSPRSAAGTLSVLLLVAALAGSTGALAGDLTPPSGNVAPTMKTLDQVEARTPIPGGLNLAKFTITQPGSYYLTGNRLHTQGHVGVSIQIMVSDVTLDLNGFAITVNNASGAQYAIADRGDDGSAHIAGVVVKNGIISGPGLDDAGINLAYTTGSRVENISVRGVTGGTGIIVGAGALVIDSTTAGCNRGFSGSNATFMRCVASGNSEAGFNLYRSSARECASLDNGDYGFILNHRASVESCVANDNDPGGPGAGIYLVGDGCRADSNTLSGNYYGVVVASGATNAIVTRNAVRPGNGSPYVMSGQVAGIFPNNHVAQIVTDPANMFTTANPWANFAH